jgi:hypothetical protein
VIDSFIQSVSHQSLSHRKAGNFKPTTSTSTTPCV